MEVHACIGRYNRSNCSNIKGNNIWTSTSTCEHRAAAICSAPLVKVARGYPDTIFKITRISSMVLLQNKSLFQVLRVDFLIPWSFPSVPRPDVRIP